MNRPWSRVFDRRPPTARNWRRIRRSRNSSTPIFIGRIPLTRHGGSCGTRSSYSGLSDQQIWNLVAFIWRSNTTAEELASGRKRFAQNCAACHGENGTGKGIFADQLAAAGQASMKTMAGAKNMRRQTPANFADAKRMLGASPALLQGKILRGGMGTGMPSWGPIFTQDQSWDLVAFLYSFPFLYQE